MAALAAHLQVILQPPMVQQFRPGDIAPAKKKHSADPGNLHQLQKQEPRLRQEAKSLWHLMTHRCKNCFCPTCMKVKMQRWPCRSKMPPPPGEFGQEVCADTVLAYTNQSWGLEGK